MAATLVLRTVKGTPLTNIEVDNNFSNLNTFGDVVSSNIGVLSALTTSIKGNIVAAINEVRANTLTLTYSTGLPLSTGIVGLGSGQTTLLASAAASGVTANTYGGSTAIPVITIDTYGRVTSASNVSVTTGTTISNDTTTNADRYITFTSASSGSISSAVVSTTKLFFNPSTGLLTSTDYNSSSDITLKQDFTSIQNPLDIINQLTGFGFTWKDSKQKAYGLSAQEVEKVIPEIVKNRPDGTKGINYMNLTAFLIEAIKDLKREIQEIKSNK
jgi:hypothetical protein